MTLIRTEPCAPVSQQGLQARLEGLQDELECLLAHVDGPRARSYMATAQQALWKAVSLARQGL